MVALLAWCPCPFVREFDWYADAAVYVLEVELLETGKAFSGQPSSVAELLPTDVLPLYIWPLVGAKSSQGVGGAVYDWAELLDSLCWKIGWVPGLV